MRAYWIDGVVANRCIFGAHDLARGPGHLRRDDTDHLAFRLYTSGRTVQALGDQAVVMEPGTISLVDRRHQMRGRTEAAGVLGVLIPRRSIDARFFDRTPAVLWSADSPQGRLLSSAATTFWAELRRASATDARSLAAGFTSLISGLLTTRPDAEQRTALDAATLGAMGQFIDRHLHDPTLGAAMLCRSFHCSRARLYRLFRPLEGVEKYIRDRRLQRCFDELTNPDGAQRRINAIAAAWGFHDPSHFHRLFKARFEMTPSDALALGRMPILEANAPPTPYAHSDEVARFHHWLRQL